MVFQQGKPNVRLRDERLRHHWSQQELADLVGATLNTVSRWERGLTDCSPYFRNKLCEVFGKDAREIGLMPSPAEEVNQALFDPLLPGAKKLIGRSALLGQIREELCGHQERCVLALTGMPGVGKSALAIALAHDAKIKERFYEGILWVDAGRQPDLLSILSRWGALLGVEIDKDGSAEARDAWLPRVRKAIGSRRLLIILDNIWRLEDAIVLLQAGEPHCSYLITTRSINIALYTAGEQMITVPELSEEAGLHLLEHLVPTVAKAEPTRLQRLAQLVGGLPLALVLIGQYLRLEAYHRQPRRLRQALEWLYRPEHRLQLEQPLVILERATAYSMLSLQSAIAWSESQLSEQSQIALRLLSVFPAKPNTFSEQAALAITEAPVEVFDQLCDAGLLESREPGRYSLHRCVADYAALHADRQFAERRFVRYLSECIETSAEMFQVNDLELANLFAALLFACKHQMHGELERIVAAYAFCQSLWKREDRHNDVLDMISSSLRDAEDFEALSEALRLLEQTEWSDDEAFAYLAGSSSIPVAASVR